MDAFPAFFPLAGRSVAIAGDGEGAEAKARLFVGSPARVVRLGAAEALDSGNYVGVALAFIAGDDETWARQAAEAARSAHVPVNVVDRPALCDFTTPSIIDRGVVVAAIGTGGASPMLATMLRQDIEARTPEGIGRVAELLRTTQDEVRAAFPEAGARRRFLRTALSSPAAAAASAGAMNEAKALLRAMLTACDTSAGSVNYVEAAGPAERLTLKAVRALASADVLVCDPDINPDVLALARRDAERLDPASVAQMQQWTLSGQLVIRLVGAGDWRAEQALLGAAAVRTEVLPVAR
ncbi:NAD(P)-dependent oxidoreductase [Phenylobacterium sp.]|jgi:precorrin-2 dehydrogenase/sirohydrochlorin ferrochelatase|uniref:NAD(P)-dependent oxidoreductase n=1 Tax=Phenylobacterium sp. TaxID=1871053 RepID=UPI0037CC5232